MSNDTPIFCQTCVHRQHKGNESGKCMVYKKFVARKCVDATKCEAYKLRPGCKKEN